MRITKNMTLTLWTLATISLLFSLTYTLYLWQHKKEITFDSKRWEIKSFCDTDDRDDTCSQITAFEIDDSGISISYILGTTIEFAYTGFTMVGKNDKTWNLSSYDSILININPDRCNDFSLQLSNPIPGVSDYSQPNTWRFYEYDFKVEKGVSTYAVNLEKFITPNWWFKVNNLDSKEFPEKDLKKIKRFLFQNHPNLPKEKKFSLSVKSVILRKSMKRATIPWIVTIILILVSFIFRPQKISNIPYHQLDVENIFTEETKILVDYLAEKYNNTELTLTMTSMDTKLSEKKIRKLLNDNFEKSFKQYLTDIRMVEARRLLKETDRSISDIASLVGYSHTPTFTRNFRTQYGKLPSKYRKG